MLLAISRLGKGMPLVMKSFAVSTATAGYLHAFPSRYGSQWSEGAKSPERSEGAHVADPGSLSAQTDQRYLQQAVTCSAYIIRCS